MFSSLPVSSFQPALVLREIGHGASQIYLLFHGVHVEDKLSTFIKRLYGNLGISCCCHGTCHGKGPFRLGPPSLQAARLRVPGRVLRGVGSHRWLRAIQMKFDRSDAWSWHAVACRTCHWLPRNSPNGRRHKASSLTLVGICERMQGHAGDPVVETH